MTPWCGFFHEFASQFTMRQHIVQNSNKSITNRFFITSLIQTRFILPTEACFLVKLFMRRQFLTPSKAWTVSPDGLNASNRFLPPVLFFIINAIGFCGRTQISLPPIGFVKKYEAEKKRLDVFLDFCLDGCEYICAIARVLQFKSFFGGWRASILGVDSFVFHLTV